MKIPDPITTRAHAHPTALAVIDTLSGARLSYADVDLRVGRIAGALATHGVGSGDRVAILSGNRVEVIETVFACARLGAIAAPLNWRLSPGELADIVADCGPSIMVSDGANAALAATLAPIVVDYDDASWAAALAGADALPDWGFRDDGDIWYLLYTSGTTGRPKGVIYTVGMALANHVNIGTAIGLTSADVTLNALPMFHTGGINLHTVPTLFAGGAAIVAHEFAPAMILRSLASEATAFFGVPTMYRLLADEPGFEDTTFPTMRSWASGGAAMPVPLLRSLAERGIVVRQGMGMTETGPTLFLIDAEHALSKAGSVGTSQVLSEVRLVDASGVDTDEGELLVRGAAVTPGYWNRPDATAEAFTADGWLRSGDIARRDADGHYWIVDRLKDMYISGGENVYPAEVERVLLTHPDVAEAAVVGVPDDRWGETGQAVLVAAPGAEIDTGEVRAHCRRHLAAFKVPTHVVVLDALPRNASGKVLKARLSPVVWRARSVVTQDDIDVYARLSGDENPVHIDPSYAEKTVFGGTIAHGMLVLGRIQAAVDRHHPGRSLARLEISFTAATRADDEITVTGEARGGELAVTVTRTDGRVVCELTGALR
ncbi:AMP-binding protein [Stackebrandtia soli]|uniref:AMP-binding protein n=1 Tax=Stackebrandtia soli TaxID=1892856 RepID=UPI0039ED21A2